MKDWQIRALKTFVQAFFGVLIPETIYFLRGAGDGEAVFPGGIQAAGIPVLCSALAAGISAVWNLLTEYFARAEDNKKTETGGNAGSDTETEDTGDTYDGKTA